MTVDFFKKIFFGSIVVYIHMRQNIIKFEYLQLYGSIQSFSWLVTCGLRTDSKECAKRKSILFNKLCRNRNIMIYCNGNTSA